MDGTAPVGGAVSPTLSLTLGSAASFAPFTPGVAKTYTASTTATVISSAGDAALSIADPSSNVPGHLVNGTFSLPSALKATATSPGGTAAAGGAVSGSPLTVLTYAGPVSNDVVAIAFVQDIGASDAAAHRHVQQDADVHAEHDDAVETSRPGVDFSPHRGVSHRHPILRLEGSDGTGV